MRRLGLTLLSTAWILAAVIFWAWAGTTVHDYSGSVAYWAFSWIPAAGVIAAPFVIYDLTEGNS